MITEYSLTTNEYCPTPEALIQHELATDTPELPGRKRLAPTSDAERHRIKPHQKNKKSNEVEAIFATHLIR
jgi:hypothetical protein